MIASRSLQASGPPGARALMILGTASGVGKSLLTAGLCRLVARAGVRVAPFKPQNMSNNAAACPSGGEIGRAQALQAFACGLEPHVDMNPVLVKPERDTRAQLIVLGKRRGTLHAERFREERAPLLPVVVAAFERLAERFDWVFVEGAGSPAEPNLRAGDIANLGFARAVGVEAWLVGDIDRGGVFASLLGTLALLDRRDRALVRALVVNRFRGSPELLEGALEWLAERAERPVLGLVPFLEDLALPEEDAPYRWRHARVAARRSHRVAAVHYPTASNTTDLDGLALASDVTVELVLRSEQLDGVDLVVLPGSKAVRRDLAWLREHGFVPAIERHLRYGGRVLGICGGMQMLGEWIRDPACIEGGGESRGLGLLPIATELLPEKRVAVVEGAATWPPGARFAGYEIHHGRTTRSAPRDPFDAVSADERVWGTYVHGLFDRADYRNAVVAAWFGARSDRGGDLTARWRADLDRLADVLAARLDLSWLERRLGAPLR
jgi:adenosylcobyric acid synthase